MAKFVLSKADMIVHFIVLKINFKTLFIQVASCLLESTGRCGNISGPIAVLVPMNSMLNPGLAAFPAFAKRSMKSSITEMCDCFQYCFTVQLSMYSKDSVV